MLAHVNKHANAEGKVVYSGTSDIVDDADCCYTLEVIEEDSEIKVVEFTNFKDRGDVDKKALFSYSNTPGLKYGDLLNTMAERWRGRVRALTSYTEQLEDAVNELRSLSENGEDTAAVLGRISSIDKEINKLLKEIKQ